MSDAPSPKAARQSLPRWLDPKLILGVLFVAVAMVLGAQVVTQADQTVEVWTLQETVPEGTELNQDEHLTTTRIRFTTETDADRYLSASEAVEEGYYTTRALGAGELLPADALSEEDDGQLRDFPIEASRVPDDLAVGDVVDVYAVGTEAAGGGATEDESEVPEQDPDDGSGDNGSAQVPQPSERVLTSVRVAAAGGDGGVASGGGGVHLTVRFHVDEESGEARHTEDDIANAAVALSEGEAYIVRRSTS